MKKGILIGLVCFLTPYTVTAGNGKLNFIEHFDNKGGSKFLYVNQNNCVRHLNDGDRLFVDDLHDWVTDPSYCQ